MCGRYVTPEVAAAERDLMVHWLEYNRSYNVAPTQRVPVVRMNDEQRQGTMMRWGLVPFFAKGVPPKYGTINATIEKLTDGACWREPWRRAQRCLIVAAGFYEWHLQENGTKTPFYITCADQPVFGFAGLWDRSVTDDGTAIESCTIITMPPNPLMADIHNSQQRMPAILAAADIEAWIAGTADDARAVLKPYRADSMVAWPVSSRVNSPKNDGIALIERALS